MKAITMSPRWVWHEAFTDSRERDACGRAGGFGPCDRLRWRRIEQYWAGDASRAAFGIAFYKHGGCASGRNAGDCRRDRQRRRHGKLGLGRGEQFAERRHFAICSRRRWSPRDALFRRREYGAGRYVLCKRRGDEWDSDREPVIGLGDC